MMIMISPEDFRQLSAACQQELLGLLTRGAAANPLDETPPTWEGDDYFSDEGNPYFSDEPGSPAETSPRMPVADAPDSAQKQVLDISPGTARELIANVSSKSLSALAHFASGQPVALDALIGLNAPYRDVNELKRSLVGAVNRRLRTVTDNRAAVLFASDRDKKRIRITARSAASLRQALNVPEPLPALEYIDANGQSAQSTAPAAAALAQRIQQAWKHIHLRPLEQRHTLLPAQTYQFLLDQGLALCLAKPIADEDGGAPHFTFDHGDHASEDLIAQIDPQGCIKLPTPEGNLRLRVFVQHASAPGALATLAQIQG